MFLYSKSVLHFMKCILYSLLSRELSEFFKNSWKNDKSQPTASVQESENVGLLLLSDMEIKRL